MNATQTQSRSVPALLWIVIVGAVGFAAGFFGPIVFAPEANQGPLVGIFISGPGGAFLGLLLYVISRALGISPAAQRRLLWTSSAVLAVVTLYSILPHPALHGYVVEGQIQTCKLSAELTGEAIQYWEKRVAQVTWASPRGGWQDDARQKMQYDRGVVLQVVLSRKNRISVAQKPWNKGRMIAEGWEASTEQASYYAQYAGHSCADYPVGSSSPHFIPYDISGLNRNTEDWPPKEARDLLNRQTLEPVPDELRKLVGE